MTGSTGSGSTAAGAPTAPVVHDARRWARDGAGSTAPPPRAAPDPAVDEPHAAAGDGPLPLIRIGSMIRTVLDELHRAPLDEAARERAADVHRRAVAELVSHLDPDLAGELAALDLPLPVERTPGDAELRVAQAQLVGWLEGVFQGAQIAMMSHQMATRAQLEQLRGRRGEPASREDGRYL